MKNNVLDIEARSEMMISEKKKKVLLVKAGGLCSLCRESVVTPDNELICTVAHIVGDKPGSARSEYHLDPADRTELENLICLCANCHKKVDDNPAKYTVENLRQIKEEHERFVAARGSEQIISRIAGIYDITVGEVDELIGFDIRKPTVIEPGTVSRLTVGKARNVTVLKIGGGPDDAD